MAIVATTGTTSLAGLYNAAYLEKTFVSTLKKRLLAAKFGVDSTMPEGVGATKVRWQYFTAPAAITTSLGSSEGEDGTAVAATTTTVTATLGEYTGYTDFSKFLMQTALSGTIEKFAEMLGYQAALSIDTLALDPLDASTTSVDAGTAMTADFVRQGVAALEVANALPHRATGGQYYVGLFHADSLYDMAGEGAPTWAEAKNELQRNGLVELFKDTPPTSAIYNCLLFKTNNVPTASSNWNNLILADESFGVAALNQDVMNPSLIRTMPSENVASKARNKGSIAWWYLFAAALFDNNRVCVAFADV